MKTIVGLAALSVVTNLVQGLEITTTCDDGDLQDISSVKSRARVLIPQSDWLLTNSYSGVADWKSVEHDKFDSEFVTVEKRSLTPTLEIHQIMSECRKPPCDDAEEDCSEVEFDEYDLIDSVSLINTIDISEYTSEQLTADIIELCASCTYTATEEEEEAAEDGELWSQKMTNKML